MRGFVCGAPAAWNSRNSTGCNTIVTTETFDDRLMSAGRACNSCGALAFACGFAPRSSLRLDAGGLHHLRPLVDVLAEIGVEPGGRHRQRHRALLVPRLLHVGTIDRLVDLGFELVDGRSIRRLAA